MIAPLMLDESDPRVARNLAIIWLPLSTFRRSASLFMNSHFVLVA